VATYATVANKAVTPRASAGSSRRVGRIRRDLPGVWIADEDTQARRRQVARRGHIVRQRTRLKN